MIEYNGKTIFDHDEEMFDLIYSTAAIMYFPNEVKDRRKRELYRKAFDHKTSAHVKSNKLDKSLFEARKNGYMAGEFFSGGVRWHFSWVRLPHLTKCIMLLRKNSMTNGGKIFL